jgi:hypothetical protein
MAMASRLGQPRRPHGFWGCLTTDPNKPEYRWVNNQFWSPLNAVVLDTPSRLSIDRLEEIEAGRYFTEVIGSDGLGLRVPTDLDESICKYQRLDSARRKDFDRAAFWLDMASRQWNISMSASFAALVSSVESLINNRGRGSAARFRNFLERHAPGISLEERRKKMYELRSGILHGSELLTIDQDISFGWDPPWWNERELHSELWTLTRTAMRNWLANPPPS